MQQFISTISSGIVAAQQSLQGVLKLAAELKLASNETKSSTGASFVDLMMRTEAILNLVQPLVTIEPQRLILVPFSNLRSLGDYLSHINDSLVGIKSNLSNFESWGGISSRDNSGTITAPNGQQYNMSGHLDSLSSYQDNAINTYLPIATILRPRSVGTYSSAAKVIQDKIADIEAALDSATRALAEINTKIASLSDSERAANATRTEIERIRQISEEDRKTIEEYRGEATTAKAAIEEVRSEAAALKANVTEYQQNFTAFQASLDKRQKEHQEGGQKLSEVISALGNQKLIVDDLAGKAKEMLGGATVAGLSSAYDKKQSAVDEQLGSARNSYYASIIFLVISILVALNLFNFWGFLSALPAIPAMSPGQDAASAAVQILAGIGTRVLVILPALLLAGFTAHRHAMLFRLREEYNHKYAIAASVHGFKQQAPQYEEVIAAAVFQELLQNPSASMDDKKVKKENGFISRIIGPQVEAALERMKLIEKSSNGGV